MSISPDTNKDNYIKKLVANVNIGLLEKCFNKKSRGYLFQDLGVPALPGEDGRNDTRDP